MASPALHLSRRLEQLLPGVIGKRYRKLMFVDGSIVPIVPDLEAGAAEVVRERVAEVGDAAILGAEAADIPVVDLSMGEDKYRTFMIASAISYSMNDMRAMEKAGNASFINARKLAIANRLIEEKDNKLTAFGNTALNVTGLLNNASVTLNNSAFNPYTATPDALAEFFIDEIASVVKGSSMAEIPGDVLLSIDLDLLLSSTRITDGAMSVKQYILTNSTYIQSITPVPECQWDVLAANGTGTTDKDRIVFYPMERVSALEMTDAEGLTAATMPEVIEKHVEPTQTAPPDYHEVRNLRHTVPVFKCTTQTIINYPSAMKYVDVAKRA